MTLRELESSIETAVELQREALRRLAGAPGDMNLLDLVSASRLENYHSDVIAFLLNPRGRHRHPEYGPLFLDVLAENGIAIEDREVLQVEREKKTTAGRRIDILIRTPKDVVIVENKLDAGDLPDQLRDYFDWCETRFASKNLLLVYLTVDGREVSEESLPAEQKDLLIGQRRGLFASYRNTVLPWLEKLTTRLAGEQSLWSAVMQYQDAVKGLYHLKEQEKMELKQFFNHFHSRYEKTVREDFQEIYGAVGNLQRAMEAIHLTKVLADIHESLAETYGPERVFITIKQRRYSGCGLWIENVDIETSDIGVEVALENDDGPPFGLAVELSDLSSSANLYFGIMSHGHEQCQEKGVLKTLNEDSEWSNHTFRQNADWCAVTRANWARDRILSLGSDSGGRMPNGRDIVQHIVEHWFSPERVRRLSQA